MTQTFVAVAAPAPEPEHEHSWRAVAGSVGLFACVEARCPWCAVCPCCLGSFEVALLALRSIEHLTLYWCPLHQARGDDAR
jgi:hypothetical protein